MVNGESKNEKVEIIERLLHPKRKTHSWVETQRRILDRTSRIFKHAPRNFVRVFSEIDFIISATLQVLYEIDLIVV